jgi:hypothetical protein
MAAETGLLWLVRAVMMGRKEWLTQEVDNGHGSRAVAPRSESVARLKLLDESQGLCVVCVCVCVCVCASSHQRVFVREQTRQASGHVVESGQESWQPCSKGVRIFATLERGMMGE